MFKLAGVTSGKLELPTKDGNGIPCMIKNGKVMIDKDLKGKMNFRAAQGEASKPFSVLLHYDNGDRLKQTYSIIKKGGGWGLKRMSGMQATINRAKILFLDDNNNGFYGDENEDAIYVGKSLYGCPLSSVVLANGALFDLKISKSGKVVEYRPYAGGDVGQVDIHKEWAGKKAPDNIIVSGKTDVGSACFDLAGKSKSLPFLPVGKYRLVVGMLPNVIIKAGNGPTFTVVKDKIATVKWGNDLKVTASASFNKKKSMLTMNPLPKVTGPEGVKYLGDYMQNGRFVIKVIPCNANGEPIGKTTRWSMTGGGGGG